MSFLREQLLRRMHKNMHETGPWLGQVLNGWLITMPSQQVTPIWRDASTTEMDLAVYPKRAIPKRLHKVGTDRCFS